jgi:hypothetical protein
MVRRSKIRIKHAAETCDTARKSFLIPQAKVK